MHLLVQLQYIKPHPTSPFHPTSSKLRTHIPQKMAPSSTISATAIVLVCLAIWAVSPCSAQQNPAGVNFLGLPWGLPCLQAVLGTQGCTAELVSSFLSLQPRILGPECCKAAISIDDNCWPKIFPFNPLFPPLIKSFCTVQLHLPPLP